MAAPTTYTENAFAEFLHTSAGRVAEVLGWSVAAGSYSEIVNEALLTVGAETIAGVTGAVEIRKFRAAGQVALWESIVAALTAEYDFSADGGSYSRSQMQKAALARLEQAKATLAQIELGEAGELEWVVEGETLGYADFYAK